MDSLGNGVPPKFWRGVGAAAALEFGALCVVALIAWAYQIAF